METVIRPMEPGELGEMVEEHNRLNPDIPVRDNIKKSLLMYVEHGLPLGSPEKVKCRGCGQEELTPERIYANCGCNL